MQQPSSPSVGDINAGDDKSNEPVARRTRSKTQPQSQRESPPRENEPQWTRDANGRLQRKRFDFANMTPPSSDVRELECQDGTRKSTLHLCVPILLLVPWSYAILEND